MSKTTKYQGTRAAHIPFSPYAQFTLPLRGFDIIKRDGPKKLFKYQVWARVKGNHYEIELVKKHQHPAYIFVRRG